MINKNKLFRQIHIYISLFFLPLALLFSITGIAYILGANQDTGIKEQTYTVKAKVEEGLEKDFILNFLKEKNLKLPSDEILKTKDGSFALGGVHYSVSLKKINDEELSITTSTRSFLGDMIMLHKDKAKWYFSILSIGFGLTLLMLYFSGLMITLIAIKKDRKPQILTVVLGFLVTMILAYMSL